MGSPGRIEAGPLLAIPGALLLLVSLFIEWYEPGLEAWEVFEVWDLVLAGIGLACLLAAADRLGVAIPGGRAVSRGFVVLGLLSLVIVLSQAIDNPPAASEADAATGLWLALGGAALLALGALLSTTRISLNVEGRDVRSGGSGPAAATDPVPPARPGGQATPGAGPEGETAPLEPPPGAGPR